jgi:hypothetical protein
MVERVISAADLEATLPAVLDEISQRGTVFLVHMGQAEQTPGVISGLVSGASEVVFALGPAEVLGKVFGLIDEEYGWPRPISVAAVKTAWDLMPRHRCHPVLCRGDQAVAMSISIEEYDLIVSRTSSGPGGDGR